MADERERLLGVPLDEFIAERTAAAKRLRAEGRADEAAELQSLRKPTAAVWALNQAARREPGDVRALVRAAEEVRKDPAGGDAEFRAHLADVVKEAARVLREAGSKLTEATERRIATTARAAAASLPDELVRGVLEEELEPTGFEAMAGMSLAPAPRASPKRAAKPKDDAKARRERVEAARTALADAREEARLLDREAGEAERAAVKARAAADAAEDAVRRAEEALDAARGA